VFVEQFANRSKLKKKFFPPKTQANTMQSLLSRPFYRHIVLGNSSIVFVNKNTRLRPIHCIIFDMDGTLTVPVIDFNAMRRRTGIMKGDILDAIYSTKDKSERDRLLKIIDDIEREANDKLQFQQNMEQMLSVLHELQSSNDKKTRPVKHVAIVTRNSQESLQFFLDKIANKPFANIFSLHLSRDFRPYKPAPDPLLHIAKKLEVPTQNCLMIGDSIHDMASAKETGEMLSCMFTHLDDWNQKHEICVDKYQPDFVINDLMDVISIVHMCNDMD
jgi:HAD superfamily hydrolase (TIGR01549 family)